MPLTNTQPRNTQSRVPILLGNSRAMRELQQQIGQVASALTPILIQGESGTGKEVVARLLHQRSPRSHRPFVKLCCPAVPHGLLESELFGHERGAFTGAQQARPGKLELAHQGTLFLDEIGDLDMAVQSKLLQAMQDYTFVRLGGLEERAVDIWPICATNQDVKQQVHDGKFREDLFYRLNVVSLHIPALRERPEDIPVLLDHFLMRYAEEHGRTLPRISTSVRAILEDYHWPGNVRELENIVRRFVVFGSEETILEALRPQNGVHLSSAPAGDPTRPLKDQVREAVDNLERSIILRCLQANRWNRRKTASVLDISYRALLYKIKDAGLPPLYAARQKSSIDTGGGSL
ncbi:MAG: sigma-54 interaction domain-containing protein [Acidobacteriaceae bacterium]